MSKQTDIRDIILFIVGILFIAFPPAWAVRWNVFSEKHEIFTNFLIMAAVSVFLGAGIIYNAWKGKR